MRRLCDHSGPDLLKLQPIELQGLFYLLVSHLKYFGKE
jgi:hypothetical protein